MHILLAHVPVRTLFAARAVSRHWHSVIVCGLAREGFTRAPYSAFPLYRGLDAGLAPAQLWRVVLLRVRMHCDVCSMNLCTHSECTPARGSGFVHTRHCAECMRRQLWITAPWRLYGGEATPGSGQVSLHGARGAYLRSGRRIRPAGARTRFLVRVVRGMGASCICPGIMEGLWKLCYDGIAPYSFTALYARSGGVARRRGAPVIMRRLLA